MECIAEWIMTAIAAIGFVIFLYVIIKDEIEGGPSDFSDM